ncbi:hypothetical protein [Polymorphospora rubra]|uniref:Uncharacterized protein n=1 Tax=Polymorphospora rubra TaxID=338584 RepID=A0A810N1W3_9ACTN|nr:hypothetical protein [Polymorphospora rubra]BCJ65688.1 hypothetical protein Prubr_27090 [Polymorphospora rubra]
MSEHTPHPHDPDGIEPADSALIDLVAGDPPVPITVWRTARTGAETHTSLPTRLAYRLVAAYSRPGDAVVDLTTDHALTATCGRGGRRHHRAWFTDSSHLVIEALTPHQPQVTTEHLSGPADLDASDENNELDPPELADWFGDDLTDPDRAGTDGTAARPYDDGPVDAATSLVVACWPLHDADTPAQTRLAGLLAACVRLLRPGGCLVLVVGGTGTPPTPEDFGPLVAAASRAGLGYLQHIVAVAADTDGDHFVYHVTDEELLALAHASGGQWTVAHWRVHADLLVFTPQQPAPTGPGRRRHRDGDGGEHRA